MGQTDQLPTEPAPEGLAVVIPAYKGIYLQQTLASFAAQTDQRFRLYVCDDGSPDDLAAIVAPFRDKLNMVYHRFSENLGHQSLVQQWDRSIALSTERWIWLFSDDDFVAPDCVAAFWAARAARPTAAGLHRFQSVQVRHDRQPVANTRYSHFPEHETWEDFIRGPEKPGELYLIIIQNIVFPRELYQRNGGFYDYPLGLWSDFITWARFSREEGIFTLPAGKVFSRVHGTSIGGGLYYGGKDRCDMLHYFGRMFADLRLLYREVGKNPPRLKMLRWFAKSFEYLEFPLVAAERAAAAGALRTGWPEWPVFREAIFWWHASRPIIKRQHWLMAIIRLMRRGTRSP